MAEVDFTNGLWLFGSPWTKHLERHRYFDANARAWVALWNYTTDDTTATPKQIARICKGLFEIPTDDLVNILLQRRAVDFPKDRRVIEDYRVVPGIDDFTIYVTFAELRRRCDGDKEQRTVPDDTAIWSRKGATLSDKSARQQFGLTQEEIYAAFRAGKLQYRESNMHGNPWFRLLRHEVEALVKEKSGKDHLHKKKLQKELSDLNKEARKLKSRLKVIERRRIELLKELEG
ncbi:MAG: hypothetical protein ACYC0X_12450 [Pirellulaceae bacterium]